MSSSLWSELSIGSGPVSLASLTTALIATPYFRLITESRCQEPSAQMRFLVVFMLQYERSEAIRGPLRLQSRWVNKGLLCITQTEYLLCITQVKSGAASCEFSRYSFEFPWDNNATLYSKWSLTGNDKHLQTSQNPQQQGNVGWKVLKL